MENTIEISEERISQLLLKYREIAKVLLKTKRKAELATALIWQLDEAQQLIDSGKLAEAFPVLLEISRPGGTIYQTLLGDEKQYIKRASFDDVAEYVLGDRIEFEKILNDLGSDENSSIH